MRDKSCSPICVETGSKDAILCWRGICVPILGGLCSKFFAEDQIINFYDEMIIWPCRPACLLSDEKFKVQVNKETAQNGHAMKIGANQHQRRLLLW
jgi:hypothetical protein